jgi:hypothetical protein
MNNYLESDEHRNQPTCAVSECATHGTGLRTSTEREASIDASVRAALQREPLRWIEAARAAYGAVGGPVEGEEVEASLVRIGARWDEAARLWRAPA